MVCPVFVDYCNDGRNDNPHPLYHVRVNFTLAHFDEFYRTYPSVTEGTPMYLAPEDRILVWDFMAEIYDREKGGGVAAPFFQPGLRECLFQFLIHQIGKLADIHLMIRITQNCRLPDAATDDEEPVCKCI